jgi:multidrug resistance protein, MATE family
MRALWSQYRVFVRDIFQLSYPIILGQLGLVLMGVADTIMVGRLGKEALAGVNQANSLFFMTSGLTFGVLFAVSTLVSIKVGEKKASAGFIIYRAGLIVSVLLFAFQFGLLTILTENFEWLQQTKAVNEIAPKYLNIVNWSILPMLVFLTARQFTDGLGHTKISMVLTLAGLVFNVILNAILIYGFWIFPAMGYEGAAWATLISRIAMMLAALWYVRYSKFMKTYVPQIMPKWRQVWSETPGVWKMGVPIALQTFAEWACFSVSGIMVGWYGEVQVAAHAVALNAASVTYMVASGIGMAGSILVGNGYGEKNSVKIRKVAHATFFLMVIFELINALIFVVFNRQIAGLYGVEPEVMPLILPLFLLAAVFQVSDGIQAAAMSLLRGIKDVLWASIISVFSYWVVSMPLSYYLGEVLHKEVYGVWTGFTVGLLVASIFGVYRFYQKSSKLLFV